MRLSGRAASTSRAQQATQRRSYRPLCWRDAAVAHGVHSVIAHYARTRDTRPPYRAARSGTSQASARPRSASPSMRSGARRLSAGTGARGFCGRRSTLILPFADLRHGLADPHHVAAPLVRQVHYSGARENALVASFRACSPLRYAFGFNLSAASSARNSSVSPRHLVPLSA